MRRAAQGLAASPCKKKGKLEDTRHRRRFRRMLLKWYDENKRDLPWRRTRDPYRVWISEIMLQQTRVAAVIEYYEGFLRRFPTVQRLAAARVDSVLAAWSGLGYYRRARALHAAAKQIVKEHAGAFPGSAEEWRQLPGVGRYTSAAIASIAFNSAVAVVDGNVERVLSRIEGTTLAGQPSWQLAQKLVCSARPGDFNQAMMELGATVCLPRDPRCWTCPVKQFCSALGELRTSKAARRQKREIHYALDVKAGAVLLKRRPAGSSLMAGMWELPEIKYPAGDAVVFTLRHSITVTDYTVRVYAQNTPQVKGGRWFPQSRLAALPLTGLARKILRTAGIIQ